MKYRLWGETTGLKRQEALGLYIHIPFCVRKCNYCDFPSWAGLEEFFEAYVEALCTELKMVGGKYESPDLDTIFLGGGTPSLLSVSQMESIAEAVLKYFRIREGAEITLEANPGTVSADKAKAYKAMGFNRVSVGFQAAQDHLLRAMGRIHTRDMFEKCMDLLKCYGFSNLNADILFGVPGQTMEDWQETVNLVLYHKVTHLSCYSLQLEENTPWDALNKRGELPLIEDCLEREMYYWVISKLEASGFHQYEISNFSRSGYESKHNLKYWSGKPYIGVGAAAHSFVGDERTANLNHPVKYIHRVKEKASPQSSLNKIDTEERLSESFFLGLRRIAGVSMNQLTAEFGQDALEKYRERIEGLKRKNLLCMEGDSLKLTKSGLDYANQVWMELI